MGDGGPEREGKQGHSVRRCYESRQASERGDDSLELSSKAQVSGIDLGELFRRRSWPSDVPLEAVDKVDLTDGNIELQG